jgi:hypothetical protein
MVVAFLFASLFVSVHGTPTQPAEPLVLGYNRTHLAAIRRMIATETLPQRLAAPLAALQLSATNHLALLGSSAGSHLPSNGLTHAYGCPEHGPWSVTAKLVTPPSGDKKDFTYISTYAWPCNAECPSYFKVR